MTGERVPSQELKAEKKNSPLDEKVAGIGAGPSEEKTRKRKLTGNRGKQEKPVKQENSQPAAPMAVAAAAQRWECPFEGCSYIGMTWTAVQSHHWRCHQAPLSAPRRIDLYAQNEPVKVEWDAECAKASPTMRAAGPQIPIMVGDKEVERVKTFCYLGSTMDEVGGVDPEVAERIRKAGYSFGLLKSRVWSRKDLSLKLKGRVFQAAVMSSLTYGAETWPVCGRSLRRLRTFYHRCLRATTQLSRLTRTPDQQVREVAGCPSIDVVLRRKRLRWFGHVRRMDSARWPSRMLRGEVAGYTKRGGHLHMWDRVLRADLDTMDCDNPWDLCLDRRAWKTKCSHTLTRGQT